MARRLNRDDVEAALLAGLFLSAGGSGKNAVERNRAQGRAALDYGGFEFAALDELDPAALIITATAVGAPGFAKPTVSWRDSVEAARLLTEKIARPIAGVICGHVPGFNAWLVASALGLKYVDAASNGRGHPTVKMGGMGRRPPPKISIHQIVMGGLEEDGSRLVVMAEGNIVRTSNVMRQAAVVNGGLIYAARGPLSAGFIHANGAPGAISFQLDLGRAMLEANGPGRIAATAAFLKGEHLITGNVMENTVTYSGGFDLGHMIVTDGQRQVRLGIYNEYMTADIDGTRAAAFPDMIGTLDPQSGDPVAIAELPAGAEVAIIIAHRSKFPVGKGALDPAV